MSKQTMTPEPSKKRILIIEDEPTLADIYQTRFTMDGFDASVSVDGINGLAAAIQTHPDIILLDVMLPGKDGFAVLQDLKLNIATEHIPVIILSNLGQDYEVVRGKKLGAARFLIKANLTPNEVSTQVKSVLAESSAPSPL